VKKLLSPERSFLHLKPIKSKIPNPKDFWNLEFQFWASILGFEI
jgi:hypothetical protein